MLLLASTPHTGDTLLLAHFKGDDSRYFLQ